MGAWSSWSICNNSCGQGEQRRTRKITQQPVCRGTKCGAVEAYQTCTDYRSNRDCQVLFQVVLIEDLSAALSKFIVKHLP